MAIKVKTEDSEFEVTPDQLQLPEGYQLVTPDSVPKGLFTQEALNKTIQERLERDREKQREKLSNDDSFRKQVLNDYNISLDDNGQPKGLKPDFDPEEWKKSKVKELTEPYEQKLKTKDEQLNSFKQGLVKSELMKSASNLFQDQYLKSFTGDDDPFVVKQFADQFDVDDKGNVYKKDSEGGFYVDNDGSYLTPSKFFDKNRDQFGDLLKDQRQKSTETNAGGGNKRFTQEDIAKMSDEEYEKNREHILGNANNIR